MFNDAFGADVSGHSAVESAFVSKGMTCHDGAVWNPSATVSNFRVGDACIPAYIGFWGMFSLSETYKFPQQKPGRWIEADTYAGIDFARPLGWDEHVSLKTWCRYRFHGASRGRVEIKFGVSEDYRFNEDWKVFAWLNVWYMDYRNENPDRTSGFSCGDASVGVGWKMFYVKATYWFRPDPRVLTKGSLPYNYSERMVYSAGVRFAF